MFSYGTKIMIRIRCIACASFLLANLPTSAIADVTWQGDFETGDTSQWSSLLNGSGISVVGDPVAEGDFSGQITISDDPEHIWPNGLNRVEFKYAPPDAATAEGSDTYFGWSFYLPALFTDDNHQIGYYESANSYQQVMSFPVEGDTIRFVTRKPSDQEHWNAEGALKANTWHDIAIHVHWSTDAGEGLVDVWFDGTQVVSGAQAQTLADTNPHFIQLGVLRQPTLELEETMIVDNARAASSIEDVLALGPMNPQGPGEGGGGALGSGAGGSTTGTGGATAAGGMIGDTTGGSSPVAPSPGTGGSGESEESGGCSTSGRSSGQGPVAWLLAGFGAVVALGRRRLRDAEV